MTTALLAEHASVNAPPKQFPKEKSILSTPTSASTAALAPVYAPRVPSAKDRSGLLRKNIQIKEADAPHGRLLFLRSCAAALHAEASICPQAAGRGITAMAFRHRFFYRLTLSPEKIQRPKPSTAHRGTGKTAPRAHSNGTAVRNRRYRGTVRALCQRLFHEGEKRFSLPFLPPPLPSQNAGAETGTYFKKDAFNEKKCLPPPFTGCVTDTLFYICASK